MCRNTSEELLALPMLFGSPRKRTWERIWCQMGMLSTGLGRSGRDGGRWNSSGGWPENEAKFAGKVRQVEGQWGKGLTWGQWAPEKWWWQAMFGKVGKEERVIEKQKHATRISVTLFPVGDAFCYSLNLELVPCKMREKCKGTVYWNRVPDCTADACLYGYIVLITHN